VPCDLAANELHVWRVSLDRDAAELEHLDHLLSARERERAARFHFDHDRNRYLVAHRVLRRVLIEYLGCKPEGFDFHYGPEGKPSIPGADLRFNLSHSGEVALIGLARGRELGVDVERFRPGVDDDAIARRFFSPFEVLAFQALPEHERGEAFFRIWTRKEAYVKARGGGLTVSLSSFDVSLDAGEAHLLRAPDLDRWAIVDLDAGSGYAGAAVVEQPVGEVRRFTAGPGSALFCP
jgi:4'-phosphopantetheinyl transferase